MIFDSHAHYDDSAFDEDRDKLLQSLPGLGVCGVVNVGTNLYTSVKAVEIAKKYSYIYAAVGIHPEEISNFRESDVLELESLTKNDKVVAIGEIGLDYHYSKENKNLQIEVFEEQVKLAQRLELPIIVHDREAHQDTMEILKKYRPRGVVHCFSGSSEMASEVLRLGMYIGIGGVVTFKNAQKLVNVVDNIGVDNVLLETDAPYLAPVPFRGKRCDSSYIKFVAEKISEIKGIDYGKVLEVTKVNALKLFGLQGVWA